MILRTRARRAIAVIAVAAAILLAACGQVPSGPPGDEDLAAQSTKSVVLSGWTSVGSYCEATFTRNPSTAYDVDGINIKIGGPIGTTTDPNYWHIDSPTLTMSDASTGLFITDFLSGWEWHESNTVHHNGPFVSGDWTVALLNLIGATCSDYDGQVKVTFTLIP